MSDMQDYLENKVHITNVTKTIGTVAGFIGGLVLGEQANDFIPQLQQAPWMIHLGVDVLSMYIGSEVTGRIGYKVGDIFHTAIDSF